MELSDDEMEGLPVFPTLQAELSGMSAEERQDVINEEHPFGIMLWKPALHALQESGDGVLSDEVSAPRSTCASSQWHLPNLVWSLTLGWILALCFFGASVLASFISVAVWAVELDDRSLALGRLSLAFRDLARYILLPVGLNLVRTVHEYSSDSDDLLGSTESTPSFLRSAQHLDLDSQHPPFPVTTRIILLITVLPALFVAAAVCWFLIVPIPMARLLFELGRELLWRDPSTLRIRVAKSDDDSISEQSEGEEVVLSITELASSRYFNYDVAGVSVVIVNSSAFPLITLSLALLRKDPSVLFISAVLSIIPCSYFIGAAITTITNLTGNLALGGLLNATFGSIVELLIYSSMIRHGGKASLIEGSLIGSFLFGLLGIPGLAMFVGGMFRRAMSLNVRATSVTVTLLILSVIGAFLPTLFHNTFAPWDLHCEGCSRNETGPNSCDMSRCWMKQPSGNADPLFAADTRLLVFFCCGMLVLTHVVGLCYALRTQRRHISKKEAKRRRREEKAENKITGSAVSRPSSASTLRGSVGIRGDLPSATAERPPSASSFRAVESFRSASSNSSRDVSEILPLRPAHLLMGDLTATSATVINSGSPDRQPVTSTPPVAIPVEVLSGSYTPPRPVIVDEAEQAEPTWSVGRSVVILLLITVAFSIIAEVLVGNVEAVLAPVKGDAVRLNPKVLGLVCFRTGRRVSLSRSDGSRRSLDAFCNRSEHNQGLQFHQLRGRRQDAGCHGNRQPIHRPSRVAANPAACRLLGASQVFDEAARGFGQLLARFPSLGRLCHSAQRFLHFLYPLRGEGHLFQWVYGKTEER